MSGTDLIQYQTKFGTNLIQYQTKFGTNLIQNQTKFGTKLFQHQTISKYSSTWLYQYQISLVPIFCNFSI